MFGGSINNEGGGTDVFGSFGNEESLVSLDIINFKKNKRKFIEGIYIVITLKKFLS